MIIKTGIGLDEITFGLTKLKLKEILGEPDKIWEIENVEVTIFQYNELMTTFIFSFWSDFLLDTIETSNPDVSLWGTVLLGKTRTEIKSLLSEHGFGECEYEEYDFFETEDYNDVGIEFTYEYGIVSCISFEVLIDDDDNIMWPNPL